ncbi:SusE domain-containing protein [Carboxylicivirga sp. A043]|uniref:SusE domain-containing protein n=1 Tax=Carboxylicivirga litoralis TaxID=2816963 RepID=UPI0021CB969F|nr:SusE domain-containing protein [Carboxylicivirga sp. A043]MCU4157415.1 SusE domain-containing protein [Carboxylicivirga sp. A043]
MNRAIIYFLIGLFAFVVGCEKEGDKVVMLDSPTAPELVSMPDLNLTRDNSGNSLTFAGNPVDPGFVASATYYLEACEAGNDFQDLALIYSGSQINEVTMTVSELNQALLTILDEDKTTSVDFRVRSILTVDAGTGAPGTGSNPFEYTSQIVNEDVTVFGFLRLDLIGSGVDQKITSPLSDGIYRSYVKLDPALPFTLSDPETGKVYGGSGGTLVENGTGITPPGTGYHELIVNLNNDTYEINEYQIGLVGSATPNGWDTPDQKMEYDLKSDTWSITVDLVVGEFKFRKNDGWAWNLGQTEALDENLEHDGSNVPVSEAGNYTIVLDIISDADEIATFTITKN